MNKKDAEHIAIFYEGQDDLIDILAVSMASVCYNTKSFVDFYILDCGIHDFNKKQLELLKEKFTNFSIEYIPIDLKQFEGLKGYRRENFVDCYSRLLIPELKSSLSKAIYLDTDTIALKDVKLLWQENLENKSIGAVADLGYRGIIKDNFIQNLGGDEKQIFLSGGLFVLDCEKWRKNKITQNLLSLAKEKKENLLVLIEDLFSLYFTDDYKLLDSRYGIIDIDNNADAIPSEKINTSYLIKEMKEAVIIHYAGDNKPWKSSHNIFSHKTVAYFDSFWNFSAMTAFHNGLKNKFLQNVIVSDSQWLLRNVLEGKKFLSIPTNMHYKYKLFNIIPLLSIKQKNNCKRYFLFGCIPFLKMKVKKHEK